MYNKFDNFFNTAYTTIVDVYTNLREIDTPDADSHGFRRDQRELISVRNLRIRFAYAVFIQAAPSLKSYEGISKLKSPSAKNTLLYRSRNG